MNQVSLVGRLTATPTTSFTNSGTAVVKVTIAVDRKLSKEKREEAIANGNPTADFVKLIVYGKSAEILASYTDKGTRIAVCGEIRTGKYEKNGQAVYTTEVLVNSFDLLERSEPKPRPQSDEFGFEVLGDGDDIPF